MTPATGRTTVLVIDDERDLVELVRFNLEREGFRVLNAPDGERGLALAAAQAPDLILLDRMMPGPDGVEICRRLRQERSTADVPVIFLTAKASEADRVGGFEAGADDYVTKPFSPRELVARVRARLRRPDDVPARVRNGDLEIDEGRGVATWAGRPMTLSPAELRMIHIMAAVPGRVLFRRSAAPGSLLLGALAVRQGVLAPDARLEALAVQERSPSRRLGEILVERRVMSKADLARLLDVQARAAGDDGAGGSLLGRLLVARGLATEFPVHQALRLQGRLVEAGLRPVPRLGEILVRRGVLGRDALAAALGWQSFMLYRCPGCGGRTGLQPGREPTPGVCPSCGAEVPSLLGRMSSAIQGVLEGACRDHAVALPDDVVAAAADPRNRFGRYLLVGLLGRGGSGVVHRAWQNDRNRYVALKILPRVAEEPPAGVPRTPFGDSESVKRFFTEARAVSELDHPNVVPLYDFGVAEGTFYCAMAVVDGDSLDARLRAGQRWGVREALALVRDAARGIDAAHERGICHRDVKPGNILVDRDGKPWVIDFGLARIARLGDSAYAEGVVVGTPFYMPPEQASGDMERVDARSDVYSLGAVLYELLGGAPPYAGLSPEAVVSVLASKRPDPLPASVPGPARRAVERAMHPDPAQRPARAAALALELDRAISELD